MKNLLLPSQKLKSVAFSTMALFASAGLTQADVTPVNIVLHDANLIYSVPAGKVLIIEHFAWALEGSATAQVVALQPANMPAGVGSIQQNFSADQPDVWTPPRPIRLVGGSGARVFIIGNGSQAADWRDVMIVGLLVDPEDLYAKAIPSELENPRVEGGRLMADAKFASPRPRVTKVNSSENLEVFKEDGTEDVSETASPSKAVVSVAADADKKFVNVEAVARPLE